MAGTARRDAFVGRCNHPTHMSYDLMAFVPPESGDALAYAEDLRASEAEGLLGPLNAAKEERKQRLARQLQKLDPRLRPLELNFKKVAASEGLSIAEARARYRQIELQAGMVAHYPAGERRGAGRPATGTPATGLQVILTDDAVWVGLPEYVNGNEPREFLESAWRYLVVLHESGLRVYDPQLGALIDLREDHQRVCERYQAGVREARPPGARTRPWWKFW